MLVLKKHPGSMIETNCWCQDCWGPISSLFPLALLFKRWENHCLQPPIHILQIQKAGNPGCDPLTDSAWAWQYRDSVSVTGSSQQSLMERIMEIKDAEGAVWCYLQMPVKCAEQVSTEFPLLRIEFSSFHVSLFQKKTIGSIRGIIFLISLIILSAVYNVLSLELSEKKIN